MPASASYSVEAGITQRESKGKRKTYRPGMTAEEYRKLVAEHNAPKRRAKPSHLESDLQIKCVQWFRLTYPKLRYLLFSVPNGGLRSLRTAQMLKAEGALAGVSDLILLLPRAVMVRSVSR